MLNGIWLSFFIISFFATLYQFLINQQHDIFSQIILSLFNTATDAVTIALGLIGLLCFWLGILKIAEEAGIVRALARGLAPLFRKLMPEVPDNHPALGSITLNMAANMLGLDNAATPIGLKAMKELQTVNEEKERASNAQIMFLVINASSITLLPLTVFLYRAQQGASDPTSVFIPILLATSASTIIGILAVSIMQKINIFNRVIFGYALGLSAIIGGLVLYLSSLSPAEVIEHSSILGNSTLLFMITLFLLIGWRKKVPVYETFIEGAKDGFQVALTIIPYLVAMLCAVALLRTSGALDIFLDGIRYVVELAGINSEFVPALPTALVKPFSGSGARAMMIETMIHYGADSFPSFIAGVIQGSTETTFYVLSVYFGAVNIKKVRHAVGCSLLADLAGAIAAIWLSYWFVFEVSL